MKKSSLSYGLLFSTLVILTACKPDAPTTNNNIETASETNTPVLEAVKLNSNDGKLTLEISDNGFNNKLDDTEFLATKPLGQVDTQNIVLLQQNTDTLLFAVKTKGVNKDINQAKETLQQNLNNDPTIESVNVSVINDEAYPAKKLAYHFTHKATETENATNEACALTTDYAVCAIGSGDIATLNGYLEKITVQTTAQQ
ncbi:hypothetical protein [Neisseria sp. Ec49-e6-T10]|uniref:hypothetical protein n=1 Tax=Neisseria sp. Ec49-e6-T10 TaxID=3140744 RepID=UPI003EBBC6E0